LEILREMLLSGQSPAAFQREHAETLRQWQARYRLQPEDLAFLDQEMGDSWETLHVPDGALAYLDRLSGKEEKIQNTIGTQNDPVVRHRLAYFHERLKALEATYGEPETIVLEFVREDFMGTEAKKEYKKMQKKAEDRNREIEKDIRATNPKNRRKLSLLAEQGWTCIYTGVALSQTTDLDALDIDHVVPRAQGGPDAVWNQVVCQADTNADKGNRTPHAWLCASGAWQAYEARVTQGQYSRKKKMMLLSPDAADLVDRYTRLAETSWIAKLAQKICCLHFNWDLRFTGEQRRVIVIPGALTNRQARACRLYDELGDDALRERIKGLRRKAREAEHKREEQARPTGELDAGKGVIAAREALRKELSSGKYRDDKRHHALDAMVLSYFPQWAANPGKRHRLKLSSVAVTEIKKALRNVVPYEVGFRKPVLREQPDAIRSVEGGERLTCLWPVAKLALTNAMKPTFDMEKLRKRKEKVLDSRIKELIEQWMQAHPEGGLDAWTEFCEKGLMLREGHLVKKVRIRSDAGVEEAICMGKAPSTGAYYVGKESHHGQIVYRNLSEGKTKGQVQVRPVYAHESPWRVKGEILKDKGKEYLGYFQTGCQVVLEKELTSPHYLPAGEYKLNTIRKEGRVTVTDRYGVESQRFSLKKLLEHGFHRVG